MAYRKIHDDFWTDPDMEEFTPEQKFFYLYLITNPNVNQIGLYEFSKKRACFETGYNIDTVSKLLNFFENEGKVILSRKTKEILVVKFYYHNKSNSPKVKTHIETLLQQVKDRALIQYIYSMDIASQEEEVQEEIQEREKEKEEEGPVLKIQKAETKEELLDIWESYRKKKGKHMNLYERDVLLNSTWLNESIHKIKKSILYTIENGWLSLQQPDNSKQHKNGRTKSDRNPNGQTYEGNDLEDFEFDETTG